MAGRPRTISDDAIMAAVGRTVSAVGPARLTLADVGHEAGLSPATLVQRFGSKRGLLLAFGERAADGVDAIFDAAIGHSATPLEALTSHLVDMASGMRTAEELSRHLAFLQLELDDAEFLQHTQRHAQRLQARIRELLDAAAAAGEIRITDTRAMARAILVTYNGALITWAIVREGDIGVFVRRELSYLLEVHRG